MTEEEKLQRLLSDIENRGDSFESLGSATDTRILALTLSSKIEYSSVAALLSRAEVILAWLNRC
jgi:hypothetical protein